MTKDVLKQRIKNKFESLSNFARLTEEKTGLDRYELQKNFALKQIPTHIHKAIEAAYRETDNVATLDIDPVRLKMLQKKIKDFGGAYKFCKANPDFNMEQVYALLRGKRSRMSKLAQSLFEHFKIIE